MTMDHPTCKTCPYWERYNYVYGHCHRYAPRPSQGRHEFQAVGQNDWCGEHPDFPAYLAARAVAGVWHPMADGPPPGPGFYLVHARSADPANPLVIKAWWDAGDGGWSMIPRVWSEGVTHWMPLPDPPGAGQ